jgi:ABC-type nickel/cobalt efflux system permease component RcnA
VNACATVIDLSLPFEVEHCSGDSPVAHSSPSSPPQSVLRQGRDQGESEGGGAGGGKSLSASVKKGPFLKAVRLCVTGVRRAVVGGLCGGGGFGRELQNVGSHTHTHTHTHTHKHTHTHTHTHTNKDTNTYLQENLAAQTLLKFWQH